MRKQFYLPQTDPEKAIWLNNLSAKIPAYGGKYALTVPELNDVADIHADFTYRMQAVNKIAAYSKQWTAYKNALRDGLPVGAEVQPPIPPDLGPIPTISLPGGFKRLTMIVKKIKSNPAYSEADGQDMGIEGVETIIDFTTLTPQVSVRTGSGGYTEIVWNKQNMDGIAIYKDAGDNRGFVLYDLDNHPNWQDKHALPPSGQSALWKYKVIYRLNDEEVGQWSNVLSITVGS